MIMARKIFNFINSMLSFVLFSMSCQFNGFRNKFEIFRVLNCLYFKSKLYKATNEEVSQRIFKFKITGFSYESLFYLFKEIFVHGDYYFESAKESPAIIDCGANIGMSVLYFKKIYPQCSVIAFEPNPFAFALLTKNINQNNFKEIRIENAGLANLKGSFDFFFDGFKGSFGGSIKKDRGGQQILNIQTHKLSEYIKDKSFDLIKIDIEGAETEVLVDLCESNTLGNSNKYIIEYHMLAKSNNSYFSDFLKPFESQNFRYLLKADNRVDVAMHDILIYLSKTGNS